MRYAAFACRRLTRVHPRVMPIPRLKARPDFPKACQTVANGRERRARTGPVLRMKACRAMAHASTRSLLLLRLLLLFLGLGLWLLLWRRLLDLLPVRRIDFIACLAFFGAAHRSEEHTSELQSPMYLV